MLPSVHLRARGLSRLQEPRAASLPTTTSRSPKFVAWLTEKEREEAFATFLAYIHDYLVDLKFRGICSKFLLGMRW
jgi:hypothetical protein